MTALATINVHIAPGMSDTIPYVILDRSESGKSLTARRADSESDLGEQFTRRHNGNFARVREDSWSMYMRGDEVTAALNAADVFHKIAEAREHLASALGLLDGVAKAFSEDSWTPSTLTLVRETWGSVVSSAGLTERALDHLPEETR